MLETQVEAFPFHLVFRDEVRQGAHRYRYVLLERWPHLPQEELQEPLEGFVLVGRAGHRFSFLERPETAGAWQEVYTTLNHELERLSGRASWGGRAPVNGDALAKQPGVTSVRGGGGRITEGVDAKSFLSEDEIMIRMKLLVHLQSATLK